MEGNGMENNGMKRNSSSSSSRRKEDEEEEDCSFPASEEEAIRLSPGYEPLFVAAEWLHAAALGGVDWKGRPIKRWRHYIRQQKHFRENLTRKEQQKPGNQGAAPAETPAWARLKALESELAEVRSKLRDLPRHDPHAQPDEFKAVEARRIPLRTRRDALTAQIDAIRKSINS